MTINRRDLFKGVAGAAATAVLVKKAPAEVDIPILSAAPSGYVPEQYTWTSVGVYTTCSFNYPPRVTWVSAV